MLAATLLAVALLAATSFSAVASPAVVYMPFAITAFIAEPSSVIGPPTC